MHESDDRERRARTPAEADERDQAAVLGHVLAEHPDQLTVSELTREVARAGADFSEGDAIERAVRDLVAAGLLHRQGEAIRPTRAALRFERLNGD
jgi:hypothetical protein